MKKEVFDHMIKKMDVIFFNYDLKTHKITLEGNLSKILGFRNKKTTTLDIEKWSKLIHPQDRSDLMLKIEEIIKNKKNYNIEYRILNTNKNYSFMKETGTVICNKKGKVCCISGMLIDISERMKLCESLRMEKDQVNMYLDLINQFIIVINSDEKISFINNKGCEILGYSTTDRNKLIGKNWFTNFVPKKLRNHVRIVFQRLIDGKVDLVEYYENQVIDKKGNERLVAWHNSIMTDGLGNILGTISSGKVIK